jgi:hypothetical protein
MEKKAVSPDPDVDQPPAYQLEPDGLPDLTERLRGLKLDPGTKNVHHICHFPLSR